MSNLAQTGTAVGCKYTYEVADGWVVFVEGINITGEFFRSTVVASTRLTVLVRLVRYNVGFATTTGV